MDKNSLHSFMNLFSKIQWPFCWLAMNVVPFSIPFLLPAVAKLHLPNCYFFTREIDMVSWLVLNGVNIVKIVVC